MDKDKTAEIASYRDVTVVSFSATSLSASDGVEEISKEIIRLIDGDGPEKMVIDFARVKFFSSQVLGLLLNIRRKLETYGGQVVISGINPQLHRVFRITNLDKIFTFYPDVESAVNQISQA